MSVMLNVSEKDRRDIPVEVILDHIENTPQLRNNSEWDADIHGKYILSPRIEYEFLTPGAAT